MRIRIQGRRPTGGVKVYKRLDWDGRDETALAVCREERDAAIAAENQNWAGWVWEAIEEPTGEVVKDANGHPFRITTP